LLGTEVMETPLDAGWFWTWTWELRVDSVACC
jgi:hypothetical protein